MRLRDHASERTERLRLRDHEVCNLHNQLSMYLMLFIFLKRASVEHFSSRSGTCIMRSTLNQNYPGSIFHQAEFSPIYFLLF